MTHLRFGPQGNFFLSASEDGLVGLRRFGTPKAQFTEQFPHRITSLVTNDDFNAYFVSDGLNSQFIKGLQKNDLVSQLDYMDRFKMFRKGKRKSAQYYFCYVNLIL